jgi:hypothetical protein
VAKADFSIENVWSVAVDDMGVTSVGNEIFCAWLCRLTTDGSILGVEIGDGDGIGDGVGVATTKGT